MLEHYTAPGKEASETLSNALEPPDPGEIQQAALNQPAPDYVGMRTAQYKYIQRIGPARELYDMVKDPDELENQWLNADSQFKEELAAFMGALSDLCGCDVPRDRRKGTAGLPAALVEMGVNELRVLANS